MPTFDETALRRSRIAIAAILLALTASTQSLAKVKDNCRRISIEGAAGVSTNVATWSIYDNAVPPASLVRSCPIEPLPGETNLEYIRRLGHQWGSSPSCPLFTDLTEVSSRCLLDDGGTKSCRIKTKISPKTDGSKKRYVEFCCYADTDCGAKLVDPIPITVVVDRVGAPESCPADNCVDGCSDCTVDVDPIAMRQLPTGPGAACRDAVAKAVNSYTAGTTAALTACHAAVAAGAISSATDCNSVTADPATNAAVSALAPVVDDATGLCATTRTPAQMGYRSCPAPCNAISIDAGDWSDVADCLRCQAQQASIATAVTIYGPTGGSPTVSTPAAVCQAAVGDAVSEVASVRARETAKCQKLIDAGGVLPDGVASCKGNDSKQRIQSQQDAAAGALETACPPAVVAALDLCGGADDSGAVAGCVGQATEELNNTASTAATPPGQNCLQVFCEPIARTGQNTCFDTAGAIVSCSGSGHDGESQSGAARSYIDNGDGTITDEVTGLMWEKFSDNGSIHDRDTTYTWANGISSKIFDLNYDGGFAGYEDWRMPTIRELKTLTDYGKPTPSIDDVFTAGCVPGCDGTTCSCSPPTNVSLAYWSSTDAGLSGANPTAYSLPFDGGVNRDFRTNSLFVRAVRGGTGTGPTYTDNGDGTITDNVTGLMWEKLSDDGTIHDKDNVYSWMTTSPPTLGSSTKIANLNSTSFAGHTDWRLPNVKEMQTLDIFGAVVPVPYGVFDANCSPGCDVLTCSCTRENDNYWSSTSSQASPTQAWYVGIGSHKFSKSNGFYVRAVRGG
jgi:hypothetical protein